MSESAHQPAGRLAFLDALRGIAVFAVFLQTAGAALAAPILSFLDAGRFGVLLFLLCSGFLIPASLERQPSRGTFWLKRLWRFYPLYWAGIAGAVALAAVGRYRLPAEFAAQPGRAIVANATMVPFLFGMPGAIRGSWLLPLELAFTALVSFLFGRGLLRRPEVATGLLLGATILCGVVPRLATGSSAAGGFALVPLMIATMFVGTTAHAAYRGERPPAVAIATGGAALLTVAILFVTDSLSTGGSEPGRVVYAGLTWGGAYGIFGLALAARRRRFPRALIELGKVGYSVYLLHNLVIAAIPQQPTGLLSVASWLLTVVVLAIGTYRWIEVPGMAFGRRVSGWRARLPRLDEVGIGQPHLAAVSAAEASVAD